MMRMMMRTMVVLMMMMDKASYILLGDRYYAKYFIKINSCYFYINSMR